MTYSGNIEQEALANEFFRKVLYTDLNLQLVVMCLQPSEDIGEESHQLDQFIRVESGEGKAVIDGETVPLSDGFAIVVPKGAVHNIVNLSTEKPMKLYTIYAPSNHPAGTIHKTKAEALEAEKQEHHT
jgi:mannose-6-phosphate isomerase-like protein (cupin superfamily)